MNMNIENCFRHELPPNLRWLGDQLVKHLKELRDRSRAGNMAAVLHEFFNCYRFDDNQMADDGFWGSDKPAVVRTPLMSDLEDELAAAKEELEELRCYKDYREASLTIRKYLEEVLGENCWYGGTTICGAVAKTVERYRVLAKRIKELKAELENKNCAYVWREDAKIAEGGGYASFGGWQYSYRNTQGGGRTIEEAVKAASALCPRIMVGVKRLVNEAEPMDQDLRVLTGHKPWEK